LRVVDVGRPVQRHHEVAAPLQPGLGDEGRRAQVRQIGQQRVDHRVADEEDALVGHACFSQVGVGHLAGGEEPVGDGVGDQAVDLLGHRPVARADAAFDVRHRQVQLLRGDGAGHGGGDVADHQAQCAAALQKQLLVAHHDRRRLLGLRARADLQVDVGLGDAQLAEEVARHALVVVLAGVHQAHAQGAARGLARLDRVQDRRDLHEVRPRAGDDVDQRFGGTHQWAFG
jgi:hypothetical protein